MAERETLPYGAWRSPITSDLIVGEAIGLGDILIDGGDIYWIEGRPSEGGRTLVAVELAAPGPGRVLAHGHDFYASAKLSPDGGQLAWLSWDHPNMPWVGTELWLAEIAADGSLAAPRLIAGGPAESIFQPQFS